MSNVKKIFALLLTLVLVISCASCNSNATWIYRVDGEEIPVGLYICCLSDANYEAEDLVKEQITPEEKTEATTKSEDAKEETTVAAQTTTEEIDYSKHKLDGKDFDQWVSDRAVELTKEILVLEKKMKEYELKLDVGMDETVASYWEYYGDFYTKLGVSEKSFIRYFKGNYMKNTILQYYYGKDGVEPTDEKEIKDYLKEKYITTYSLQLSKTTTVTDENGNSTYDTYDEKILKQLRDVMDGYAQDLKKDAVKDYDKIEKDFQKVTNKICGITASNEAKAETEKPEKTEDKNALKETENIQVYTDMGEDNDDTVKNLSKAKIGQSGWFETDGVFVVYFRTNDVTKNPYYLDKYTNDIISKLKEDDFKAVVEKWSADFNATLNKAAVKAYNFDIYEKAEKENAEENAEENA